MNVLSRFLGKKQAKYQPGAFPPGLDSLSTVVPAALDIDARIEMGVRCRDADHISKVPNAGNIVTENGQRIQIMHNGIRVVADGYCGAWMTKLIGLCRGHHEAQEEALFDAVMRSLPAGGSILEIGGYWAFYSIWFLKDRPGRTAILVEPDPSHIAVGQQNLQLNNVTAEFLQGYVGNHPGEIRSFTTEKTGVVKIPCVDIPGLLRERGIDRLSIFHCDAQGAELDALQQMKDLFLAGRVQWVFVSTHHHSISGDPLTHQRCLMLLRKMGATIEAEHDVQESFSGDGLICARFGDAPDGWALPKITYNRASESLFRHLAYDLAAANGK